jgi:hypothetical protein
MTAGELKIMEMVLSKARLEQSVPTVPAQREAFFRACMAQIPEAQRIFLAMQSGHGSRFHFKAIAFSQKKCFSTPQAGVLAPHLIRCRSQPRWEM